MTTTRQRLILILGDQLDEDASALRDFDPSHDTVWMAEVLEESTHIPSSKQRTTVFLSITNQGQVLQSYISPR